MIVCVCERNYDNSFIMICVWEKDYDYSNLKNNNKIWIGLFGQGNVGL